MTLKAGLVAEVTVAEWVGNLTRPHRPQRAEIRRPHAGQVLVQSPGPVWISHHDAEYIMWNDGLDEAQAGIKITERNINSLRYADDTTLMTESEKEQ